MPAPPKQRLGVGLVVLPDTAGLGDVDQDGEQPGPQRRTAFEAGDALEHRDPGVLYHVLSDLVAAHVSARHPQHRRAVPVHQLGERRLVAGL
jgi:hypothetical protein